jgi:hypothetical protein
VKLPPAARLQIKSPISGAAIIRHIDFLLNHPLNATELNNMHGIAGAAVKNCASAIAGFCGLRALKVGGPWQQPMKSPG